MYLTRFEINPARRGAKRLLGSPQAMHAAVLAGYSSSASNLGGRVLWRIDRAGPGAWLYVVSPDEPDFTHLVEQAGWPTTEAWDTRSYEGLLGRLQKGDRWAFRLTANPTRSTRLRNSERSQRLGHVTVQQQLDWVIDRTKSWGVRLPESEHGPALIVRERRTWEFKRQASRITISAATFDGELIVEDPDLLRRALCFGIGPAKAYGCGLMTLAPSRGSG